MLQMIKRKLSLKVAVTLTLITLPIMVIAAYIITDREQTRLQDLTIARARTAAMSGAKMYGQLLENGIENNAFTAADTLSPAYEEIKGYDFGEHPRFHTKYDAYTDRTAIGFQDAMLDSSPEFLFAIGEDLNGFVPTHNTRYSAPLTGDHDKDLANNRSKRKFGDAVGLAAAKNTQPYLLQEYQRDTGELAWDVSSPIFVKGQHFGAFRVGVSIADLAASKRALMGQLALVFGIITLVTVGFIFLALRRATQPLKRLTDLGNKISVGEGLDQQIRPETIDEIGQMASSMNRLRASLQLAMNRLGE